MKVLNLYAGIGGNRKLWKDVEVTAIEKDRTIAKIYQNNFKDDRVLIVDAHNYLLENFNRFDFIWSSPPCPTHSRMRKSAMQFKNGQNIKPVFPDMKLYEEILLLDNYCKSKWVVENVISFYDPLIRPFLSGRHYFWSNFVISNKRVDNSAVAYSFSDVSIEDREKRKGFDLSQYDSIEKEKILNNCVEPELGLHIFDCAFKEKQTTIFNDG